MSIFLITGAAGSLGRRLTKRLTDSGNIVIAYSRDEAKHARYFRGRDNVISVIGDVRDYEKLDLTFAIHKPDYVIHAAALKRVDDLEIYPDECLKTNINGSQNVAKAALVHGVKKCILVSTDKACQPVNVYGSSKFIAERLFTNFDFKSDTTIFSSVRYGNVIASRGSFIPLWLDLINKEENINVTSMDCSRFLFTLSEAVDTVLGALDNAEGGEVFIPKINSYDMQTIIASLEKITGKNISYEIMGMRPGEKIHEDMLAETELPSTYEVNDRLMVVTPQYTRKNHSYNKKYLGKHYNSSLHLCHDIDALADLINDGISQ